MGYRKTGENRGQSALSWCVLYGIKPAVFQHLGMVKGSACVDDPIAVIGALRSGCDDRPREPN